MAVSWALLDALIDRSRVDSPKLLLAGVFAGLAILTRLDSVVYLVGLYAAVLFRQWGSGNRPVGVLVRTIGLSALPAAVLVVPWLVWKLSYYGELLPNTFYAKSASGPLQPVLYGLFYVVGYLLSYGTFLLVGRFMRYRRSFFAIPGVAPLFAVVPVWLAYIVYVGADFMEYRFIVILTPLLAMLAAWLVDRFVNPRSQVLLVSVLLVFSLAHRFVVPPLAFPVLSFRTINHWPTDSATTWYGLGSLLAQNFPGGPEVPGQPVIAVAPLGVISYFSDLETIDMLGLTDAEVARNGDDAQMYYPGHVKMATPAYLQSRGVDLIVGQPGPTRDPQQYDGYRLSQLVSIYPVTDLRELPDEAVVVELPATTTADGVDIVWPTIYLGGNDRVDEAIERNGWAVKPIIRECDPDDLDVWLTRLVASRTCPDL
jgi:arabinofuranosyltransferase